MTLVFRLSLITLLYIYAGYPLLVWILARLFGREPVKADITPGVSLLIPAYNEEAHLEAKLRNSAALDYPRERLEIVVASDGSTDRTNAIARPFASQGVRLLVMRDHLGKTTLLNRAVGVLRGELIVFSDASSELEPGALRQLVRAFADPRVGCVSGCYRLRSKEAKPRDQGEGLYWRYETSLKTHEGLLHSILGAHGAFYAIRKRLFRPLEPGAINDDYLIPMRIVEQGSRAIYEPSAVAWEREPTPSVAREFARRRRIAAGNWQQIAALRRLLHPARGWVAFCFFSHKVLRPAAPFLLVMLLLSSGWLARPWAAVALLAQGIFYALALLGSLCGRHRAMARWLSVPLYFCLGNLAALSGFVSYCLRRRLPAWR